MVLSMDRWIGKVAIVTGASSGIGASIVAHLVENGLIVAGLARRSELVEKHAQDFSKAGKKGKLYAVKADLTREDDIVKAFKWVEENLGPVNILVNNAGGAKPTSLTDGDTQVWRHVLNLNVLGLCIATREAVRVMKMYNINGHIVHINSTLGHQITTHHLNIYPATKFAVTALTETLRQELNAMGTKIKVTSVSPGLVATEATIFNKNISADMKKLYEKLTLLNPEDIADGVVYALATPEHVQIHELTIRPL